MSEIEGSESRSIGAFFLGFLTGVLVCLGAGGALFMVQSRRTVEMMRLEEMRAREAAEVAAMERDRAMVAEREARQATEKAEKALREVKHKEWREIRRQHEDAEKNDQETRKDK
jgi:hypothetical protein